MTDVLTQQQLSDQLTQFRTIIQNFDYSEIKNVTFLNMESLYTYIAEVEDNPFERQYSALQQILDLIEPYLPFAMGETAVDFLMKASQISSHEEMDILKDRFASKTRMDFINTVKSITREEEWEYLVSICENIRRNRELVVH